MTTKTTQYISTFEKDVTKGLSSFPKSLSSKYFYDKKGDKLFQDIMAMPTYYLTDSEYEIIASQKEDISVAFQAKSGFDLIELGAGDGKKTKVLLKYLSEKGIDYSYLPIDISQNVLDGLKESVQQEIPNIDIKPQQGTYFEVLDDLASYKARKKVILFLGSNIGNLLHPQAIDFLAHIQEGMNTDDLLFMGFDQKKNPQTILDAYNDKEGITAAFNKNVLHRINNELNANFDVDQFLHWEVYDPETGTAKSYLVSKKEQLVKIDKLQLEVPFNAWETIHTEISQKYDDNIVSWLASESGLQIVNQFTDSKGYYKNYIFKKK
ncbi:L-histidine N(alpha)-methyltransferase [uncultured Dokdonia sp.]|mgnify:CR=1 FL=1|uniref:L-histidine N(alpha)-methyltransferase n=1 Tax=uncultured Dokdonia sp. TaxID=575653 RepID=UPI0026172291|nr:L-histidine N(alpha)-methyltransferase [uncultured Dokdonia sp.]